MYIYLYMNVYMYTEREASREGRKEALGNLVAAGLPQFSLCMYIYMYLYVYIYIHMNI